MEENELEEGEAYSGQDEDIDPDALSYIDEKLQHVLGHFQKEFEGGVSAETLGAKFGGYGSFLPAYQRSPPVTLSQPKSPVKVPSHNLSRSPHNLQPETLLLVGCQNTSVLANAITKDNSPSIVQPTEKSGKRVASISLCRTDVFSQQEFTRPTLDIRDPKSLKVRIKVGPDNPLIKNKPKIYSDLGLDVSPSPSPEDSPVGNRELSPEFPDAFIDSPSTILQTMTCLDPGSYLLSPLSETLLLLFDKEGTSITNIRKSTSQNVMPENCNTVSCTTPHAKNVRDFTVKENKSREKCQTLVQGHGPTCEDVITTSLKNEIERKTPASQNFISSIQDMALSSIAKEEMHLGGNSMMENSKMLYIQSDTNKMMKEKNQALDLRKDNPFEFVDNGRMDGADNSDKEIFPSNRKPYSKPHIANGIFDIARKRKTKSQKNHDKEKPDPDQNRTTKNFSAGFEEHLKEQPARKACLSENKLMEEKDEAVEDGKMIKGCETESLFIETNKEKQNILSSVTAPLIDAVPESHTVPEISPVVLIEDNWVCCDICQRWRLLPYGTKPESLPKKWHCSMQVWLPGLNNCSIEENETTIAIHERYQFPAPLGDTNMTAQLRAAASSITSADPLNPGRGLENAMHNVHQNGMKKNSSTDAPILLNDSSLTNLPNSSKNLFPPSENKGFNDVSYCTETNSLSKHNLGCTSRSEKHIHKQKKLHTTSSSFEVGGNINERSDKTSEPICKRGTNVDVHRTSKKFKKDDGSYHLPKDFHSGIDTSGKMTASGSGELLDKAHKNILQNYSDHSSKDLKSNSGPCKKLREENYSSNGHHKDFCGGASEAEKPCKFDSNDKKRKLKELQERQASQEISKSSERVTGRRLVSKEKMIEGELRRQKKAKVVKSEGKESHAVIGGENIEKKGFSTRITLSSNVKKSPDEIDNDGLHAERLLHYQGNAISGQSLDRVDGLKRDVNYMRSLATTSSSSKVSGSQKGKVNIRGSPVESVSSSPMKILSTENNSARRNSLIKDNIITMGYSGMGSPKRFSDGEFDGSSDQSGTRTKDPSNDYLRSSEIYRSADSGVLDSLKLSHDYEDTETRSLTGVKAIGGRHPKIIKRDDVISTDIDKTNIIHDSGNVPIHPKKYHLERSAKYHSCDEDEYCGSSQKHHTKNSLQSMEKRRSSNSDKGGLKVLGTVTGQKDLHSDRSCNSRLADAEYNNLNSRKKSNLESHSKQHKANELRAAIAGENKSKPTSQKNLQHASSHERQNSSGMLIANAVARSAVDLGKERQLSNNAKEKLEKKVSAPQTTSETIKGGELERYPLNASNSEALKSAKLLRKFDEQNVTLPNLLGQPAANVPESSSPMKKDGHPNVNVLIKEARDLKHTANRFKGSGLEDESCGIFFESALKFLHAAFLLEPLNTESTKQGELIPSTQALLMYFETAKFCEFCAHEYERLKEMVPAALAYKCAEVAYLKVAYYKHPSASKDRLELQIALDAPMPGESPSSSASDIDNFNNQGAIDKVASTRALNSPQIAGNHAISARNRPHVMRLLTYTNYLNCAFEATKKSQNAIAAASTHLRKSGIDVCSARKVLDFNFHNVDELLRLVRVSLNPTVIK